MSILSLKLPLKSPEITCKMKITKNKYPKIVLVLGLKILPHYFLN